MQSTTVVSATQLLNELRERYCDLDLQERQVAREEIRLYAQAIDNPEMLLTLTLAELNRSMQQAISDLQSLRKGA